MFTNTVTKERKKLGKYRTGARIFQAPFRIAAAHCVHDFYLDEDRMEKCKYEDVRAFIGVTAGFIVPKRSVYLAKLTDDTFFSQTLARNLVSTPLENLRGAKDVLA